MGFFKSSSKNDNNNPPPPPPPPPPGGGGALKQATGSLPPSLPAAAVAARGKNIDMRNSKSVDDFLRGSGNSAKQRTKG